MMSVRNGYTGLVKLHFSLQLAVIVEIGYWYQNSAQNFINEVLGLFLM
jgi:hypothetical protein